MAQKETQLTVSQVENELKLHQAHYYNYHGSTFTTNGAPDILACANGQFYGIECKISYTQPYINQLRQAIYITRAGGRYIVAKEDFTYDSLFNDSIPIVEIANEIGSGEFTDMSKAPKVTYEIKCKEIKNDQI